MLSCPDFTQSYIPSQINLLKGMAFGVLEITMRNLSKKRRNFLKDFKKLSIFNLLLFLVCGKIFVKIPLICALYYWDLISG